MVKVIFEKSGEHFIGLRVSGHAYSDKPGRDLVCAGVSTLAQTLVDAVEALGGVSEEDIDCSVESGFLEMRIKPSDANDVIDIVFKTMIIGIEGIQGTFPKYVKHRIKEVHGNV